MNLLPPLHFVGISGIGMSALARLLRARGVAVSGCTDERTEFTDRLAAEGIPVAIGHAADHVNAAGTIVVSSAIASDNAEIAAARRAGTALMRRGSLLASLMDGFHGIAVAGTHGKTTTTAMLAAILEAAKCDPTVVVGGELTDGSNARNGSGRWFVAESDESDGSFCELNPRIALVTNIENDHVTCDAELHELNRAFELFVEQLDDHSVAVIGTDEPRGAALAARPRTTRTVTFGFSPQATVCAESVGYTGFGSTFDVLRDGELLGMASLGVPGAINVQNALGAVAAALEVGVDFGAIASALARFRGVRRRFEVLVRDERLTVVDDYAHHPTAVEATIAAARAGWDGEIIVAFEPHRYSRTAYLAREFALALRGADKIVLCPVYAASEPPVPGIDAALIGDELRGFGADVRYVENVDAAPEAIARAAAPGSLALMLGAGTITNAAHRLAERVRAMHPARVAP